MTLLETTITLSIASLLTLACFSSYAHYEQRQELEITASQFISSVAFAKEISQLGAKTVYLCASNDHQTCNSAWEGDIIIFTSNSPSEIDNILKIAPAIPSDIHFTLNSGITTQNTYFYFKGNSAASAADFSFSKIIGNKIITDKFKISATGIVRKVT